MLKVKLKVSWKEKKENLKLQQDAQQALKQHLVDAEQQLKQQQQDVQQAFKLAQQNAMQNAKQQKQVSLNQALIIHQMFRDNH